MDSPGPYQVPLDPWPADQAPVYGVPTGPPSSLGPTGDTVAPAAAGPLVPDPLVPGGSVHPPAPPEVLAALARQRDALRSNVAALTGCGLVALAVASTTVAWLPHVFGSMAAHLGWLPLAGALVCAAAAGRDARSRARLHRARTWHQVTPVPVGPASWSVDGVAWRHGAGPPPGAAGTTWWVCPAGRRRRRLLVAVPRACAVAELRPQQG